MQGAKLLEAVPKFEYARQTEAAHVEWVRTSRERGAFSAWLYGGDSRAALKPGWCAVLPPPPVNSSTLDALSFLWRRPRF